jgi:hypothetical protein
VVRSLPYQVQSYAYDLAGHGDWYPEQDYGYVWYPRVEVGWAPYTYGRWGYTHYGHTWISNEPWGWAPYHYGRWGFGHRGWYWIPGATWGPAWVSFAIGPTWVGWSPLGYHNQPVFVFNSYFGGYGGYGGGYYPRGGYNHHRGGWNVCSRDDFRSGVVTPAGYRRLEPDSVRASIESVRFVDAVSSLDRDLNPRTAHVRPSASALRTSADPPKLGEAGSIVGGESRPSPASRRSEDALRGFRERAATSSPRVMDDTARTASRRGERPSEISDIVRRAREIQSASEGRERPVRDRVESPRRDAASGSIEGARSRFAERSRATESEASPPPPARSIQSERRERFERARERVMPILHSRETPSTRASRAGAGSRETGTRAPVMRAPETRSEPRNRAERAEPRTARPTMPSREAPSREMSGGGRSFRERSSSVVAPSSGGRGGGEARGSQSSRASQPSQRGSARPRSNQD